jgi:hypothetical protein
LKGTHAGTIPARLGLIWLSGFRGEDLNMKAYDVRRMDDGRQVVGKAHMVWPCELQKMNEKYYILCFISNLSMR